MSEEQILVVEDEVIVANQIERKLMKAGYSVVGKASTGYKAIELAEKHRPNLVLMDIKLEGDMDGVEAAEQIHSKLDIPVIYLTAHADEETLGRAKLSEPLGYLVKPFEDKDLMSTIEIALYKSEIDLKLKESEKRYRSLFEGIPMPLFRSSPEGEFLDANPAFVRCLRYPDFEALRSVNAVNIYVDPEDRNRFRQLIDKDGVVHDFQTTLYRRDGSIIHATINSHLVREASGEILCYEGSLEDITERKDAEDEMKRRLMKFILEDGNMYLVKEMVPTLSQEAFKDLLSVGFHGTIISRTYEKDWKRSIKGDFTHIWMAENGGKRSIVPKFTEIEKRIKSLHGKNVILLDRLDYLIFKNDFRRTLSFIQSLRELIALKRFILILSIDPMTLKKQQLRQIEKECRDVESRHESILSEDLMSCLRLIYRQNVIGIKPSYSIIAKELHISRPTVRKRLTRLISSGFIIEHAKGNSKVVELTDRGRELFWK